ncbi:phosphopantothenoylcysteine decarboxylase/phosphopantothenate--cysteine ligase [Anseongella ginsenosidimutans]|uniref:Coenzyme A biosynthesis bifunctional protein CoaBC n=1 Tax=Anseongella ginsenosidimutans TaxID=496056 RepID=A0A4R3KLZ5_9SPHI|nr:bifunctional phosphopantothenoylcysteine decarboxylase/phosphopantothenate--cysteine ligase CoaBC [Anseongella ginsenosidimutans]QEC54014.1 bifunctional phosphopantothenoylcysteine decarboxylase/phosphopantothenate--cysteine ligase CoaBC [Anseongella ginsenosidimutans]TCS85224.1 phosphopantothenoylcysteine decarboxylase/phosphopantothenate--cysteine ligase [Anseongella ginsenosidimutans]
MLRQKNILLGVCGSIAAYKAAVLVRHLVKEGANVRVIMTPAAAEFITPLTLATLSGEAVLSRFSDPSSGAWNNHVALGAWADLLLIAPASANTISKLAGGACDNLLTAVYLSAKCPVCIAPAMDLDMWKHPSTTNNIALLEQYGNRIIPPAYGELASGLTGEGRLAEPEHIVSFIAKELAAPAESSTAATESENAGQPGSEGIPADITGIPAIGTGIPAIGEDSTAQNNPYGKLKGKKVLLTAGPTYEALDPVRFIGNRSTGKMGFALAEELAGQGAEVELVSGPVLLETKNSAINRTNVSTAAEMHEACMRIFPSCDIAILSAAVSDYVPATVSNEKIKKDEGSFSLKLLKSKDILAELGKQKKNGQILVGFALETNNELENAREKLRKKNLDLIILNSLRDKGAGFGTETNKVTLLRPEGEPLSFPLKLKSEVAKDIIQHIQSLL